MGSFGVTKGEILRKGLRAAGRSESIEGEGEVRGNIEEDAAANDVFQATMKQSKELLARQKDLLRQVVLEMLPELYQRLWPGEDTGSWLWHPGMETIVKLKI